MDEIADNQFIHTVNSVWESAPRAVIAIERKACRELWGQFVTGRSFGMAVWKAGGEGCCELDGFGRCWSPLCR